MRDEILSYTEMCMREGMSLQRGMNFRPSPLYTIVLMSQRRGAPYEDSLSEDGEVLEYEGHDVSKTTGVNPKTVDQPWTLPSGGPTENAKFAKAAETNPMHLCAYMKRSRMEFGLTKDSSTSSPTRMT